MPVVKTDPVYGSTKDISDWSFRKKHVELDRGGRNTGTFMTGEATLIAAGPPRLADMGDPDASLVNNVIPIAVTENVSVNQNKMLQQIFEIGSRRSYFVSGHVTGSIGISRPMFNGPSLLRVLTGGTRDAAALDSGPGIDPGRIRGAATSTGYTGTTMEKPNANDPQFYINLHAEIFDRPLGLLFFMIDQRNREYAKMYVEDAMIQAHAFNIASQAMTIAENVSMMFDRIVPVSIADSTVDGVLQ
jgi:hypothetical protein